jgi:alcohol dehydrogenase (cytochrome c)
VLDRLTGEFLHGRPFVKQTWAEGLDARGRPIELAAGRPSRQGSVVYPSIHGGTNWWSPSYDPASNTFFVAAMEMSSLFTKSNELTTADGLFYGSSGRPAAPGRWPHSVRALDASTGELRWEHRFAGRARMAGVMSTAGHLVFGGDGARFFALDSDNGTELWRINTGDEINAAPITYLVDGRQQVTIAAGRTIVTFSLDGR